MKFTNEKINPGRKNVQSLSTGSLQKQYKWPGHTITVTNLEIDTVQVQDSVLFKKHSSTPKVNKKEFHLFSKSIIGNLIHNQINNSYRICSPSHFFY